MEKPTVKLIGQNGNTMNLLSICTEALEKADMHQDARDLTAEVFNAGSYNEALQAMMKYCDVE